MGAGLAPGPVTATPVRSPPGETQKAPVPCWPAAPNALTRVRSDFCTGRPFGNASADLLEGVAVGLDDLGEVVADRGVDGRRATGPADVPAVPHPRRELRVLQRTVERTLGERRRPVHTDRGTAAVTATGDGPAAAAR